MGRETGGAHPFSFDVDVPYWEKMLTKRETTDQFLDQIRKFIKEFYRFDKMVIVLLDKVESADTIKEIKKFEEQESHGHSGVCNNLATKSKAHTKDLYDKLKIIQHEKITVPELSILTLMSLPEK